MLRTDRGVAVENSHNVDKEHVLSTFNVDLLITIHPVGFCPVQRKKKSPLRLTPKGL
jgi:hypothetical protein